MRAPVVLIILFYMTFLEFDELSRKEPEDFRDVGVAGSNPVIPTNSTAKSPGWSGHLRQHQPLLDAVPSGISVAG